MTKPGAPWDASPQNVLRPTGGMKTKSRRLTPTRRAFFVRGLTSTELPARGRLRRSHPQGCDKAADLPVQAPTKNELVINPWTVRKTLEVDGYLWGFLAGARGPIPAYPRHVRKRQTAAYRRPPAVLGTRRGREAPLAGSPRVEPSPRWSKLLFKWGSKFLWFCRTTRLWAALRRLKRHSGRCVNL
jgi:hypothetical protein